MLRLCVRHGGTHIQIVHSGIGRLRSILAPPITRPRGFCSTAARLLPITESTDDEQKSRKGVIISQQLDSHRSQQWLADASPVRGPSRPGILIRPRFELR